MKSVLRCVMGCWVGVILSASLIAPASANSKYAAIIIQADSGDVLFDRHSNARRYPASLTKMMTLYLLFEEIEAGRLSPSSQLTVSSRAVGQPPSKLGLKVGATISVETAIEALVVKSANDVAVVVAEAISGSEWRFAQKMTAKAQTLGMRRTTFRNASGLPNNKQVTTARDLATLGQRLIQDYPQQFHYFAIRSFSWQGKIYRTHNALVKSYDGADGLKTGYTRRSGFNLATSATRNGQRLIGIVLGGRSANTRDAHMRKILDQAYTALDQNPALVASLHRNRPTPRLKPTLLAQLESQDRSGLPFVGVDNATKDLTHTTTAFANRPDSDANKNDMLGALIASADSHDLNEFERARLDALTPRDGFVGEGDTEALFSQPSGWSVQIGAYSTQALARKELEGAALRGDLEQQARAVMPTQREDGSKIYRARFTSLTEAAARATCNGLKKKALTCFVVSEAPPL